MSAVATDDSSQTGALLQQAAEGDPKALSALLAPYRPRLRQMVRLRLDRRLQGKVDPSEVLQEAFGAISEQIGQYAQQREMSLFLWMRMITGQKLAEIHRRHFGAQTPEAGQEVSLYRGALPRATSVSLAAQLVGKLTSATLAAQRAQMQLQLQEALNSIDPLHREILALRHFEMLSNTEAAQVLGISKAAASEQYMRALKRLQELLTALPAFKEYSRRRPNRATGEAAKRK